MWLAAALGLARARSRPGLDPGLRRYCSGLALLSLADAWLTSEPVPGLGPLPGAAARLVPLGFVLAGDYRFLLLVTAGTPDGALRPRPSSLLAAGALTLCVPLLSQGLMLALPASLESPRLLYFVYEVGFLALALALLRWFPGLRANAWLRSLSRLVMLYYGLWALADGVLLVSGADWAYALRVVPNLLYYGGFIAAVAERAPRRA